MTSAKIRAYFMTPKGLLVLVLVALTAVAYPVDGQPAVLRLGLAVVTAVCLDLLLQQRRGRLELPDSALLTGFIVAMVISQRAPLYAPVVASGLAILSKHFIRIKSGHVFNPAALGLLITALLFSSEQSWWGGLGDLPAVFVVLVALGGVLIAERTNKFPSILAFTATYFGLLTLASMFGNPLAVADTFREPMSSAALFFAFFMLTDPPTTPAKASHQVWFSMAVAAASLLCLAVNTDAVYYLLVGLLAGNAIEAARRSIPRRRRKEARTVSGPRFPSVVVG